METPMCARACHHARQVVLEDAVLLFHTLLYLAPLLEVALLKVPPTAITY